MIFGILSNLDSTKSMTCQSSSWQSENHGLQCMSMCMQLYAYSLNSTKQQAEVLKSVENESFNFLNMQSYIISLIKNCKRKK